MTSLLQTHSYTIVTKALHTFKMKQSYMILSNKVSCYDLPAAVSCRLKKILCSLFFFFFFLSCNSLYFYITSNTTRYQSWTQLSGWKHSLAYFCCLSFGHLKKKKQEISSFPAPFLWHPVTLQGPMWGPSRRRSLAHIDTSFSATSSRCETFFWCS